MPNHHGAHASRSGLLASILCAAVLSTGCDRDPRPTIDQNRNPTGALAERIELAHGGRRAWERTSVIEVTFTLTQQDVEKELTLRLEPATGRYRLTGPGDIRVMHDGERTHISNAAAALNPPIPLPDWPMLLSTPWTMMDAEGLELAAERTLNMKPALSLRYHRAGADPSMALIDPESHELRAILRLDSADDDLARGVAIVFEDSVRFGALRLATMWRVWSWDDQNGLHGAPLDPVRITNLEFSQPRTGEFTLPD